MEKNYEKPMISFVAISSKEDVLSVSSTLMYNTQEGANIDNLDVHAFDGFFKK